MASLLKAIFPCIPIGTVDGAIQLSSEKAHSEPISQKASSNLHPHGVHEAKLHTSEAASRIVSTILSAKEAGPSLDLTIQDLVHQAGGWSEYLAAKILTALEAVLKAGEQLSPLMQEAFDNACEAAKVFEDFAAEYPVATAVFCTVIAIGVLVVLAPYVLEILGFGAEGPIAGEFASLSWRLSVGKR